MRSIVLALLVTAVGRTALGAPGWQGRLAALDLPLTFVPATAPAAFLVFLTGDGGWQTVDRTLAEGLAPHGVTTVGWSTFTYFVTAKSPARVGTDLARVVDALAPERLPVYVGGYSFGAEVVPVVLAERWSAAERRQVAGLLLLGPSASASFRIDPRDWVRDPPVDSRYLVANAVRALAPLRTLCIGGVDDPTCVCPELADVAGMAVERVPGDHHFERGMPRVIAAAARKLFHHQREDP